MRHVVLHRETEPNLASRISLASEPAQRIPIILGFQGPLLVPPQARAIQLDNLSRSQMRRGVEGGVGWGVSLIVQAPHPGDGTVFTPGRQVLFFLQEEVIIREIAITNQNGCFGLLGWALHRLLGTTHTCRKVSMYENISSTTEQHNRQGKPAFPIEGSTRSSVYFEFCGSLWVRVTTKWPPPTRLAGGNHSTVSNHKSKLLLTSGRVHTVPHRLHLVKNDYKSIAFHLEVLLVRFLRRG